MTEFGPTYSKINTLWKRDPAKRNIIIPGEFSVPEHEYLCNNNWFWTRKIDGTNTRIYWNGEKVVLGGRTDNAQIPAHLSESLRDKGYLNEDVYRELFGDAPATVFGEGYGPRIQKDGGLYRDDPDFAVFDVLVGRFWLRRADVEDIAGKLGAEVVPEYGTFSLREAWDKLASSEPLMPLRWTDAPVEGMVGVPSTPLFDRQGHRLIVKIKVRDVDDFNRYQEEHK